MFQYKIQLLSPVKNLSSLQNIIVFVYLKHTATSEDIWICHAALTLVSAFVLQLHKLLKFYFYSNNYFLCHIFTLSGHFNLSGSEAFQF